jgi:hypothetical protein
MVQEYRPLFKGRAGKIPLNLVLQAFGSSTYGTRRPPPDEHADARRSVCPQRLAWVNARRPSLRAATRGQDDEFFGIGIGGGCRFLIFDYRFVCDCE